MEAIIELENKLEGRGRKGGDGRAGPPAFAAGEDADDEGRGRRRGLGKDGEGRSARSRLRFPLVPQLPVTKPNPPGRGSQSGGHGALPRRRRRLGGKVARGGGAGVPALPGPCGAAHGRAVGGHARGRGGVRAAGLLRAGLLRRHLRAGHLPAQPPHRLPLPHGRPGARGARGRARAPHPRLRRVQAFHPPPPRVQVLVCHHKSLLHCFRHDLLLCIRRTCLLANTFLLLDCALCPDNEATDCAYDQVQVCPVQLWKAEVWRKERPCSQCIKRLKTGGSGTSRANALVICEASCWHGGILSTSY